MSLFQSNLRKQIRKLPKIENSEICENYSLLLFIILHLCPYWLAQVSVRGLRAMDALPAEVLERLLGFLEAADLARFGLTGAPWAKAASGTRALWFNPKLDLTTS